MASEHIKQNLTIPSACRATVPCSLMWDALERSVKVSLGAGAKPAEVGPSASRSCADVAASKQHCHSAADIQAEESQAAACAKDTK